MVSLCQSAPVNAIFSERGAVEQILRFEAALARAEAASEVIPFSAAETINAVCRGAADQLDTGSLIAEARKAGNLAIPTVRALTALVRTVSDDAARYVHWGATSQDAIDTATVLQIRSFLALSLTQLRRCCEALLALTEQHRGTVMSGRTWLQHAVPITFGLKTAGWLDTLLRHETRLSACCEKTQVLQFGGASGTLASLGSYGQAVSVALAAELQLALPAVPWHTQRDRFAELAMACGLLVGTMNCIAGDLSLMMQTEVAELSEPLATGQGGSSTMPHKRNPVAVSAVLTAGMQVPGLVASMLSAMKQEHERALGGWQAEWQVIPEIATLTCGALEVLASLLEELVVYPDRMRANLDLTGGLVLAEAVSMALARALGKEKAHEAVEQISRASISQRIPFGDALKRDLLISQHLRTDEVDELLDPKNYLGSTELMIDRVVNLARAAQEGRLHDASRGL